MLRAASPAPAEMFLVAFLYLLGSALYDLRARSAAPEVMAVALALLGLAFSHPMGAAIASRRCRCWCSRCGPTLVANSAFNVVLALVFPTVFALGAFAYVSWVFPGQRLELSRRARRKPRRLGRGRRRSSAACTGSLALDAALAVAVALVLGAPVAPVVHRLGPRAPAAGRAAAGVRRRCRSARPAITVATGLFGNPAPLAVAAPILAAVDLARVPVVRERLAHRARAARAGWIGGILGLAVVEPRGATQLRAALDGSAADRRGSMRSSSAAPRSDATACWSTPTTRRRSCSAAARRAA